MRADLPLWQIKSGHLGCGKLTRRANHQKSVQPLGKKFFAFAVGQISARTPAIPCPQEGRFAIVTDVGCGMRWTRSVRLTSVLQRTAKLCRSDAPMLVSSLREEAQATVSNKPGHRGEREVSRKPIARGMPGRSGVTVVTTLVCFVLFRTRGCGCIVRPAFPAPSDLQKAERSWKNSRETCGEIAKLCLRTALFEI